MKQFLFISVCFVLVFSSKGQVADSTITLEKDSAYFKNALSLAYGGIGYRCFPIKQFGIQVAYGVDAWGNDNGFTSIEQSFGLSFFYTIYRGKRMSYYLTESNQFINRSFGDGSVITGLGVIAEVLIRGNVSYGIQLGFLNAHKSKRAIIGVTGVSLMYDF